MSVPMSGVRLFRQVFCHTQQNRHATKHDEETAAPLAGCGAVLELENATQPDDSVSVALQPYAPRWRDVVQKLHAGVRARLPATRDGDILHRTAIEPKCRGDTEDG